MTSHVSTIDSLRGRVHIWLARPDEIDDPERLARYRSILSTRERERHDRFFGEAQRHMFLVAHALVRTTLSRYVEIPPELWAFREGEHGRPEIDPPQAEPRLRFNLSHTLGLVACAVCLEVDCGVDVERLDRVKDLDGVARRVFTERERTDLGSHTGAALQGRFTDYWSLKEAYIKARGTGFQIPPGTFSVRLGDRASSPCTLEFDQDFDDCAEDWQLALFPIDHGLDQAYRLALAVRRGDLPKFEIVVREVVPCD